MAITIQQQPYSYTALKQKLIVVATSTNVGQPGFRYVVEVTCNGGNTNTFYVQPNLSNLHSSSALNTAMPVAHGAAPLSKKLMR